MILRVSDHAMLRFFERAHRLPVEELRSDIARKLTRAAASADEIGARLFTVRCGHIGFLVKDQVVVTCLGPGAWGHREGAAEFTAPEVKL